MLHLFIINPAAGSRDRTADYKEKIEAACKGLNYRVAVSQCPGDCERIARERLRPEKMCASTPAAATVH